MGNIFSRTLTNVVEDVVLRIAKIIDTVSRAIKRNLSSFSSYCFSKLFGYDVVINDDSGRTDMLCGPGNVCLLPASKTQQRQLDKRRRSERRKRAEAAALGKHLIERHNSQQKEKSPPKSSSSSIDEKVSVLHTSKHGATAHKPVTSTRNKAEKVWVMGNISPSGAKQVYYDPQAIDPKTPLRSQPTPLHHTNQKSKPSAEKLEDTAIDDKVLQRMLAQRHAANTVKIRAAIQPRRSSKAVHKTPVSKNSSSVSGSLAPAAESAKLRQENSTSSALEHRSLLCRAAQQLPHGALSLVPPPLETPFRHPFTAPILAPQARFADSKSTKPLLYLAHDEQHNDLVCASPQELSLEEAELVAPLTISRPSSGAGFKVFPGRRSMDAGSIRSIRSDSVDAGLDLKLLATKAVKEGREKRGWKDEVNKVAMQRCLQQQQHENMRRSSATSLDPHLLPAVGGVDKALHRVRTQGTHADRRTPSPTLSASKSLYSPPLRTESPLHSH